DGARYVRHAQTELAGALAVDRNVERGIIQFLGVLEIAQEGDLGHLRLHLHGVGGVILQADSLHGYFDGRRRSEAHHLADDVAGFERDLRAREGLAETGAQFLAQRLASGRGGFQRDLDDGFLGPAGEQVDQIHRVAGRYDAHEVAGDFDVVGSDVAADDVQRAQHLALGLLHPGSGGGAKADAQNGGIDIGEDLGSHLRTQNRQQGGRCRSYSAMYVINRTFQHMKDDGISVDVQFLLALPIPGADAPLRTEIESLANRLIHLSQSSVADAAEQSDLELRLNSLVQQAFALTPEEVSVLAHSLPPRDPIALLPTA